MLALLVACGKGDASPTVAPHEPSGGGEASSTPATAAESGVGGTASPPASRPPVVVEVPPLGSADLAGDAAEVGATLAAQWCERGSETFRPPPKEPALRDDEWPIQLESCDDVEVDVLHRHQHGDVVASVLAIDAGAWDRHELLLLQSPRHVAVFGLRQEADHGFDEGPVYVHEYTEVGLHGLEGGRGPVWIARTQTTGGDNFEADRCYSFDEDVRELTACTERDDGFACGSTVFHRVGVSAPRPEEELYDCGDSPEDLDPASVSGFELEVELDPAAGALRFAAAPAAIDEPEAPPHLGVVPLSTLLEDDALEPVAAARRP